MAEYFFPGPSAGLCGTDGKDGGSIFPKEVRKNCIFYYPSNHIMKREAYSARGGSHVPFSESQSLSEPLCFQGQASQVNGQRPGGDGGELKKSCPI